MSVPPLEDDHRERDPLDLFSEWYRYAEASGIELPETVCLATATPDGVPSARMVFLRGHDERGFVFYTNYESRKGRDLETNPCAALLFHWAPIERQVRIEGKVARVSTEESEAYFASRERGSQIGAWASRQSRELSGRTELDERVEKITQRFEGQSVPLPSFWGGYRLAPLRIEFWQGRASRLHDRVRFSRESDAGPWHAERLFP